MSEKSLFSGYKRSLASTGVTCQTAKEEFFLLFLSLGAKDRRKTNLYGSFLLVDHVETLVFQKTQKHKFSDIHEPVS